MLLILPQMGKKNPRWWVPFVVFETFKNYLAKMRTLRRGAQDSCSSGTLWTSRSLLRCKATCRDIGNSGKGEFALLHKEVLFNTIIGGIWEGKRLHILFVSHNAGVFDEGE